jgi:hypothetical protein
MKIVLILLVFTPTFLYAQTDLATTPIAVNMCDLYRHPEQYSGKMVKFRASVVGLKLENMQLDDFTQTPCGAYMRVKADIPDRLRSTPPFDVERDEAWTKLTSSIGSKRVMAHFTGLFEPYFVWRNQTRTQVAEMVPKGAKKKSGYDAVFVIQSVSDVQALDIPRK